MPLNKSQRKPSNETLASLALDSTLDSRMSSAEIPQMELLKINYVQQCKASRKAHSTTSVPKPQQQQQLKRPGFMPDPVKYIAHKPAISSNHNQFGGPTLNATSGNKIQSAGAARAASNKMRTSPHQPLPPPTIESWKFIHQMPQAKPQMQRQQSGCADATPPKFRPTAASSSTASSASVKGAFAKDTHADSEDYVDAISCCNSACNSATQSSCSSDENDCAEDGSCAAYRDCEKSNSWNYRARISTCDIRRDIARAGVKSRADRIARIEKTDCAHQHKPGASAASDCLKRLSPPSNSVPQMPEVVSQINRLFEQTKQPEQWRSTKQHRAPAPPPPPPPTGALEKSTTGIGVLPKQPLRPAPTPIKEPNMRTRPRPREPLPSIEERVKRFSNSSVSGDCLDCAIESRCGDKEELISARKEEFSTKRASPEQQRPQLSRIPKPINEAQQRNSASSAPYNETNEQLQLRIRQMFEQEEDRKQQLQRQIAAEFRMQCAGEKIKLRPTKSTVNLLTADKPASSSSAKLAASCEERMEESLLNPTRLQALANFQKIKTERVHIRKKRQPLLIINQLSEAKATNDSRVEAERGEVLENCKEVECNGAQLASKVVVHKSAPVDASRRTCGYKNCNFANCPISATSNATGSSGNSSASTPQLSDEELSTRKRLSLESCCSDSGVSSAADAKEHKTKENNIKNLGKCEDCVKILLSQGHNEPTIMQHKVQLSPTAATSKIKEFAGDKLKEGQITIHVGKVTTSSGGDPNDVQNFAKKNLTKPTTDELLTAASAKNNGKKLGASDKLSNRTAADALASANKTKQCNIANDLKNNEQRIYNNTNGSNIIKNTHNTERQPLCATTIKIDDDWVNEQQSNCDTDSLMAPPTPPPRIASKSPSALQHFNSSSNNNNKTSRRGDNDKHSVKIFVRSSMTSAGVGGNPTRASSVSMNSYTSQASGCSMHSDASALTNTSKSSTSGSSYTTISSDASSSNVKCVCHCRTNAGAYDDDESDENADYFGSLDRMTKSAIYFNPSARLNVSSQGSTQSDTIRACATSPTPSADTFCKVSCVECGEVTCNEEEVNPRSSIGSASSGIGSSGGIFWNNAFLNDSLQKPNVSNGGLKNKSAASVAERNEQEQCCCSLTSCDEDNCSFYECDGGIVVETATDDDHCVSRIEVQASVHAPNSSSNGSGSSGAKNVETRAIASSNNNKGVCDCDCAENKSKSAIEAQVQRIRERERCATRQQQQQEQQWLRQRMRERDCSRQMQFIRNSSAEEILIRNKMLLRKADVIHELRPRSMDCVIDSTSGLLNGDNTGSSPDSLNHPQNQQDAEVRRIHRGHVLTELLETERIYVTEMASILKGYRDQMLSEEMMHLVPASLQGKEDILFGNLHELFTFHNDVFLKDLENCISTTELVALCFVQRRDTFYRLYSFYCQNIPRSDRLRETLVDTHLFLQECQKRLGHKLPLGAYLLKPVQRITKYKLLLENLLSSSDSGSCTKELQKALDCMLIVLRCVNDSMHQVAITGFPSTLSQQGELLLQDPFQVWMESKKDLRLRKKPQQRHIFLYQKSMIFCKKTSKPGHNKSTYQFKHQLKLSQIGLTESVRGDLTRFEVWLQGRQEVHTLQATTEDVKNKWVTEIKRLLLNQLEELKGEKIKQYSMNHHGLRQTTSWDTPNILLGMTQRAVSCDASSESSNRNSNCSSSGDDAYPHGMPLSATGNGHAHGNGGGVGVGGAAGGDKDQQEACGWSSDYSNSEDEMSIIEDSSAPGSKFVALADYTAMGHSEVSMREGGTVELLKVGCAGWWFVRDLEANTEGWTPAAYLEPLNRKSSRSSSRNQERINLTKYVE